MDGLRAVNVYAIETEEGLTLVDGGWAVEESRRAARGVAGLDRPQGLGTSPASWSRTCTATTTRRRSPVRREFGSHVSLGLGDKATLDLVRDRASSSPTPPSGSCSAPGPTGSRGAGRRRVEGSRPATSTNWRVPRHLAGAGPAARGRQPHHRRGLHAGAHPGPLRVRRRSTPGCSSPATTCCPPSRRRSGSSRPTPSSRSATSSASLAKVRAMPDLRLLPAHGAVTGSTTPASTSWSPTTTSGSALCLRRGAGRPADGVRRRGRPARGPGTRGRMDDLDVFNAALASMETLAHLELLAARGGVTRAPTTTARSCSPPPCPGWLSRSGPNRPAAAPCDDLRPSCHRPSSRSLET